MDGRWCESITVQPILMRVSLVINAIIAGKVQNVNYASRRKISEALIKFE